MQEEEATSVSESIIGHLFLGRQWLLYMNIHSLAAV